MTRAEALLALNRAAEAQTVVEAMDARPVRDPRRLTGLKARATLAGHVDVDLEALRQKAAATPIDGFAKLAYAQALAGTGDYERALAELLAIVRWDRKFGDDVARRTMLTVFEALPNDSELARRYRRELAAAIN